MTGSARHLHKLVAKNVKLFRLAWQKTSRLIQNKLPSSLRPTQAELQPVYARNAPKHPLHRIAYLKQSKGRWYTTHSTINAAVRRYTSGAAKAAKYDRSSFPKSTIGNAVNSLSGRAPFATTLRPNLTGGTLNRTAGGYALGSGRVGGARYFSHTPAAPAQVVHNVSQAVRAFLISGQKAQFDGVNPHTGEKRYRSVTALQKEVGRKMNSLPKATPGSFIEFNINPTITALTPLSAVAGYTPVAQESLNSEGLLDVLSIDFSRSLKDLAAILNDLKRLSDLGDLPITYLASSLRVHFPGCDADTVERLCDELGVRRGLVRQDEDFDAFAGTEIALLFPFAPSKTVSECEFFEKPVEGRVIQHERIDWRNMLSPEDESVASVEYSTLSDDGLAVDELCEDNPWISSPSGYESVRSSEFEESVPSREAQDYHSPLEYQGFEGIYRFIEQCDAARR
ncbi:hypothetical protein H2201_001190 [Coniosporium apollinis]|uniref:Casein kinase II beta 2 subunit n=1 Tax=Coniosporium apollinis TaxID=61459 RepID=A0ABQ9P2Q7_9PEZI|nr:hypothetical protein H2201_001190 [Coniosporium apollinis]